MVEAKKDQAKPVEAKNDQANPEDFEKIEPEAFNKVDLINKTSWNFKDLGCVLGYDLEIFAARLPNSEENTTHILTGMDHWLDNLMGHVCEISMFDQKDCVLQKHENKLLEIDYGNFPSTLDKDVAEHIAFFLKFNHHIKGQFYWLFKGNDNVKFYDLTSLLPEATNHTNDNESPNAVKIALAALHYKIARHMLYRHDRGEEDEKSIKKLLENSLVLSKNENCPRFIISVHYLLTELCISNDDLSHLKPKVSLEMAEFLTDLESTQSLNSPIHHNSFSGSNEFLNNDVTGKCELALKHIVCGLDFLKKKKDEEKVTLSKVQFEGENKAPEEHFQLHFLDQCVMSMCQELYEKSQSIKGCNTKKEKEHSWDEHKKIALKALVVFVTLCQESYIVGQYGFALQLAMKALYFHDLLCTMDPLMEKRRKILLCYTRSIVGHCFFNISQNLFKINLYIEQFETILSIEGLYKSLEDMVDNGSVNQQQNHFMEGPTMTEEEALTTAKKIFGMALSVAQKHKLKDDIKVICQCIAYVENTLGVITWDVFQDNSPDYNFSDDDGGRSIIESVISHYMASKKMFSEAQDPENEAFVQAEIETLFQDEIQDLQFFLNRPENNGTKVCGDEMKRLNRVSKVKILLADMQMQYGKCLKGPALNTMDENLLQATIFYLKEALIHYNEVNIFTSENCVSIWQDLCILFRKVVQIETDTATIQDLRSQSIKYLFSIINYNFERKRHELTFEFQVGWLQLEVSLLKQMKDVSSSKKMAQLRHMIDILIETIRFFEADLSLIRLADDFMDTCKILLKTVQEMLLLIYQLERTVKSGNETNWARDLYLCALKENPNSEKLEEDIIKLCDRILRDCKGKIE